MTGTQELASTLAAVTQDFIQYVGERVRRLQQTVLQHSNEASEPLFSGACDDIITRLRHVLDSVTDYRLSAATTQRFTYFLAAWADEYLMRIMGEQLPRTSVASIEARLFGTREAGERVFQQIDELLREQSEVTEILMPSVHWILVLGFTGQFGDGDETQQLRTYRQETARYIAPPIPMQAPEATHPPVPLAAAAHSTPTWIATGVLWLVAVLACTFYFSHTVSVPRGATLQRAAPFTDNGHAPVPVAGHMAGSLT